LGFRALLLPLRDTNLGLYISSEFAIPLQKSNYFVDYLSDLIDAKRQPTQEDLNQGRLISNRWDLSGGIQGRIFAFGKGNLWRGFFGWVGYRGSVLGGQGHGLEAGFGIEIWRIRLGGTWFRSMYGPLKDQGVQIWGVKIEGQLLQWLGRTGF
jgi:hypothetical protein